MWVESRFYVKRKQSYITVSAFIVLIIMANVQKQTFKLFGLPSRVLFLI